MPHAESEPSADAAPDRSGDLAGRLTTEVGALDAELTEIEMLVAQARAEA